LPDNNIQFDFIPRHDAEGQVNRLLEQSLASGTLLALVLVGCPREVQEQVLAWQFPCHPIARTR